MRPRKRQKTSPPLSRSDVRKCWKTPRRQLRPRGWPQLRPMRCSKPRSVTAPTRTSLLRSRQPPKLRPSAGNGIGMCEQSLVNCPSSLSAGELEERPWRTQGRSSCLLSRAVTSLGLGVRGCRVVVNFATRPTLAIGISSFGFAYQVDETPRTVDGQNVQQVNPVGLLEAVRKSGCPIRQHCSANGIKARPASAPYCRDLGRSSVRVRACPPLIAAIVTQPVTHRLSVRLRVDICWSSHRQRSGPRPTPSAVLAKTRLHRHGTCLY